MMIIFTAALVPWLMLDHAAGMREAMITKHIMTNYGQLQRLIKLHQDALCTYMVKAGTDAQLGAPVTTDELHKASGERADQGTTNQMTDALLTGAIKSSRF